MPYDADQAPEPTAWLAEDERDRLEAVEAHHRGLASHARTPRPRLHAALHLVVENQLAAGDPPEVRRALERLLAGGLPRHEAIHAIGLVVADATSAAMDGRAFDPRVYGRELDALTVERWRALSRPE
ncbi:DUF1841 family protein [Anaeromyxobacter oryzae]|uniref:DUF1841 family protein n=1 Tax=Anaeromyxobacter oryzae TaxID=2918170 RepID=A0ABM7WRV0_9BACT|nr:DUF1841 family protein [Anaeromyxobacter oryzae]BDG02203.1 hypothetical protein AMOR_11990 [Anaeromyxobacter oryzae]